MKRLLIIFCLILGFCTSVFGSDENFFKIHDNSFHNVKIFNHGLASFEERLRLIESAKETIDVEYFIVKADLSSRIFLQALLAKRKEGVRIRMLIDHTFSADHFSPFIAAELINAGIEVKYFNPLSKWKILKIQYRNHRKGLIIDNQIIMTGGRNIGDEYFDLNQRFKFLDRDIVLEGSIVEKIAQSFNETFNSDLSIDALKLVDLENWTEKRIAEARAFLFNQVLEEKKLEIRNFASLQYEQTKIEGICQGVSFISEYPDLGRENKKYNRQVKFDLKKRVSEAGEEIVIDSPYFITDKFFKNAFSNALERGVAVKLLTNSLNSTDVPIGAAAFDQEANLWMKKGMKIYVYKGHRPESYQVMSEFNQNSKFAVHAKTMVFDDRDTYIGTYNVDPRSASYNTELMIACENSPAIASLVKADIKERMNYALFLDSKKSMKEAQFYSVNFSKRMKYYLSIIPAILFKHWL